MIPSRTGLRRVGTALLATASAFFFAALAMGQGNPQVFNNAPTIALPSGCTSNSTFVLGDVTGEGKTDLVMLCGVNIVTLPGNGDGTFATASAQTTALSNSLNGQIALADVDGDGKLDLVTDDFSCNLDVFLGKGDGTFQSSPTQIPEPDYCGSTSEPFLVADFNNDSKPDLVLESIYGIGTSLTVFLNTSTSGSPSFDHSDVTGFASGSQMLTGLAVGKFTGQNVPDLVVGITSYDVQSPAPSHTANSVEVLANNGSGTGFTVPAQPSFTLPWTTNTGSLGGIAAGDFNGDSKADLAVSDPADGAIFVLYGDGVGDLTSCSSSGSTTSVTSCQTASGSTAGQTIAGLSLNSSGLLTGKFNGLPGLLFKNENDGFSILLGAAGGILQTPANNYVAGTFPSQVVVGDLNGDVAPDAIISAGNGLSVFLNNTAGILEGTQAFLPGTAPEEISLLQNFFGNGEQDVAVALNASHAITVLGAPASGPNGTLPQLFGPNPLGMLSTASATALTSGCLDNSSPCTSVFVAAATYDTNSGLVAAEIIYTTASGPSFPSVIFSSLASQPVTAMAAGDFNGDGKTDLAFAIGGYAEIEVFTGNGDGTFSTSPLTISDIGNTMALAVADFNGDGKPDIAVVSQNGNSVGVLLNTTSLGNVSFQTTTPYPILFNGLIGMTVGDFDGDGHTDIAVVGQSAMTILLNQGSGTFAPTANSPIQVSDLAGPISTADFNGDGNLDLAVALGFGNDSVEIFTGDGAGHFATTSPPAFSAGSNPVALAAADFNGDGKPDIAVADESGNMVTLLLNGSAAGTMLPPSPFAEYSNPVGIDFGAVNVGSSGTQQLTLTNTGSSAFTLSGFDLIPGTSSAFVITNIVCNGSSDFPFPPAGVTVTSQESCTITLRFAPTSEADDQTESLIVKTNTTNSNAAAAPGGTGQVILLQGDGVEPIATTTTVTLTSSSYLGLALPTGYALVGNPVTVNFSVQPVSGSLIPTGTVIVEDGFEEFCNPVGMLTSGEGGKGSCPLTIVGLGSGSTPISAQYTPDTASSSAGLLGSATIQPLFTENLVQIVNCGIPPSLQTATQGMTTTYTFTVCLAGDVNAAVTALVTNGCPASAQCSATVTAVQGQSGVYSVVVKITTSTGSTITPRSFRPFSGAPPPMFLACGLLLAMLLALQFAVRNRASTRVRYAAGLIIVLALLLGNINGCSSSSSGSTGNTGTPLDSYTINVTIKAGTYSVIVPLSLTVTK